MTPRQGSRWTDDVLDPWRRVGDPLADEAACAIEAVGGWAAVNGALSVVERNDAALPEGVPDAARRYLERSASLPADVDVEKLALAQRLFTRDGPWIMIALHCASLPYSYTAALGVKALYFTGAMNRQIWRRLLNTAQFIVDVMMEGGFSPEGHAIRSAQKVRLMHAAVRVRLAKNPQWDLAWGSPLNQEDLAGTLLTFSCLVVDALRKMGVAVSDEEADAYLHAWSVVGHLLGVDRSLRADDMLGGETLGRAIERRHMRPSTEGRVLTQSLLEYLEGLFAVPGLRGLPHAMIRHLIGDAAGDVLGIEAPRHAAMFVRPFQMGTSAMSRAARRSSLLGRAPETLGRRVLERMCRAEHGVERAPFRVPETLQRRWALRP